MTKKQAKLSIAAVDTRINESFSCSVRTDIQKLQQVTHLSDLVAQYSRVARKDQPREYDVETRFPPIIGQPAPA
jgi:hypothetical protein